jgi:hypothetical protein
MILGVPSARQQQLAMIAIKQQDVVTTFAHPTQYKQLFSTF